MAYTPSDIYRVIEPPYITQGFGENPQNYKKFGLAGHNGWDWRTKWTFPVTLADGRVMPATPMGNRPLLAPWQLEMYKIGFDRFGLGNYFEVIVKLYSTWKITYGHCSHIPQWNTKKEGEEMAISGSTGNSTADHVHETVKRIKTVGSGHVVLNYENGYFGAVNNQEFYDELRKWKKEHSSSISVEEPERNYMNMYNGYDLDNPESMKVAVDSHLKIVRREVIGIEEHNKDIEQLKRNFEIEKEGLIDQSYNAGVDAGRKGTVVLATSGQTNPQIDYSQWETDSLTVETTIGNQVIVQNYVKKS